jgi:FKBP-type peptidyl-prolyl cis-trans isomerase SlyD
MPNAVVARNKVVSVTYVLRNQRGDIFEYRDLPVDYVHGAASSPAGNEMFPKIEQALEGRAAGERIVVQLGPADAFGDPDPGLTFTDDLDNVPPELAHIGGEFQAQNARGETLTFIVTRVADGKLTVDANHPLAGQTVTFEVTVQRVRDAKPDEVRAGKPLGDPAPPVH